MVTFKKFRNRKLQIDVKSYKRTVTRKKKSEKIWIEENLLNLTSTSASIPAKIARLLLINASKDKVFEISPEIKIIKTLITFKIKEKLFY